MRVYLMVGTGDNRPDGQSIALVISERCIDFVFQAVTTFIVHGCVHQSEIFVVIHELNVSLPRIASLFNVSILVSQSRRTGDCPF